MPYSTIQPQIKISKPAKARLEQIVQVLSEQNGRSISRFVFVSDLILNYILPTNGNGHPSNQEEKDGDII